MKSILSLAAVALFATAMFVNVARAEDKTEAKTITGKSACATCSGVTKDGHAVMLIDKQGMRWVLTAADKDDAGYKKAHDERKNDKTMTATLADEPKKEKDADGKEYMVASVKEIKIES